MSQVGKRHRKVSTVIFVNSSTHGFGLLTFKDPNCVNAVMIDPKRAIPREEKERTKTPLGKYPKDIFKYASPPPHKGTRSQRQKNQKKEISKKEYTKINRDVSHLLYDMIGDSGAKLVKKNDELGDSKNKVTDLKKEDQDPDELENQQAVSATMSTIYISIRTVLLEIPPLQYALYSRPSRLHCPFDSQSHRRGYANDQEKFPSDNKFQELRLLGEKRRALSEKQRAPVEPRLLTKRKRYEQEKPDYAKCSPATMSFQNYDGFQGQPTVASSPAPRLNSPTSESNRIVL
ncbi:hypothetical protein BDV95DRAFT_603401 [Massariosphaeria phaeospora]|uniref:HMG box domain-containing protein n=1 Tax=Massariosphaeria phaeospora TaxID=100035 RepID=A0A7C8MVG9_9PLEO|nr:hypothetical protein BDV95DRAFT_603401 [Massariosphaeria phaeospora]